MKTIWKYEVPITPIDFELELPIGSKILSFGRQGNISAIWVLVNPKADKIKFEFRMAWTGESIESRVGKELEFIGTEQFGSLVCHLFLIVEG